MKAKPFAPRNKLKGASITPTELKANEPISNYIATSVRNKTQLLNTNKHNNLTYTFNIRLPQHNIANTPLFYYCFQFYSGFRVKYISFDEWKTIFLNKLRTINQANQLNQFKQSCMDVFYEYTELIPLKSVEEVNKYYSLYINLIEVMDIIVESVRRLDSNDSESKNKTNDNITQFNKQYCDYLVESLNKYKSKSINDRVTLFEIINTFDEFNKRYVQFNNILFNSPINYQNKYNTILIPKEYFNYPDYIDYSINYPFMVNPNWTYWIDSKPVKFDSSSNTIQVGYNIDAICKSTKFDSNNLYYKYKDDESNPKMLIALNLNYKPIDINKEIMDIPCDFVCFVLSQNEFNHLEPNVMPWIFA